jgi:hypothetical protein
MRVQVVCSGRWPGAKTRQTLRNTSIQQKFHAKLPAGWQGNWASCYAIATAASSTTGLIAAGEL